MGPGVSTRGRGKRLCHETTHLFYAIVPQRVSTFKPRLRACCSLPQQAGFWCCTSLLCLLIIMYFLCACRAVRLQDTQESLLALLQGVPPHAGECSFCSPCLDFLLSYELLE